MNYKFHLWKGNGQEYKFDQVLHYTQLLLTYYILTK